MDYKFWDEVRNIVGACFGATLESYDFFAWFLLANEISEAILGPTSPESERELFIIGTFGGTFLVRPVGAFLWGYIGDRHGRASALQYSTNMIAFFACIFGCIPNDINIYRNLILASVFRGVQALNYVQVPGCALYLTEQGNKQQQNRLASLSLVSSGFGMLLAIVVVGITKKYLTANEMLVWGWRVPFILEPVCVLIGHLVQRNMQETRAFHLLCETSEISMNPLDDLYQEDIASVVLLTFLLAPWFSIYATVIYLLPWYATNILNHSSETAVHSIAIALLLHAFSVYIGGSLSDSFGHLDITYIAAIAYVLLILPLFQILLTYPDDDTVYKGCVVFLATINGFGAGGLQILSLSLFDEVSRRNSGLAISWNISMCVFSGGFIFVNSYGVKISPLFPAYFITVTALISFMICQCHFMTMSEEVFRIEEDSETEETTLVKGSMFARRCLTDAMTPEERNGTRCRRRLEKVEQLIGDLTEKDTFDRNMTSNISHPERLRGFYVHHETNADQEIHEEKPNSISKRSPQVNFSFRRNLSKISWRSAQTPNLPATEAEEIVYTTFDDLSY